MKVKIADRTYIIWFGYSWGPGHKRTNYTKCYIGYAGTDEYIYYGSAYCDSSDRFCKETGRKLALAHALDASIFSRRQRALFWKAYFARGHQATKAAAARGD